MIRYLTLFLALVACTPAVVGDGGEQPDIGGPEDACQTYQYVELYSGQDPAETFRIDLDDVLREQTPRIEACWYSVSWVCQPCAVGLYATAPDLEPYPEGGQAWTRACTEGPIVTYRVTRTLCGEEE